MFDNLKFSQKTKSLERKLADKKGKYPKILYNTSLNDEPKEADKSHDYFWYGKNSSGKTRDALLLFPNSNKLLTSIKCVTELEKNIFDYSKWKPVGLNDVDKIIVNNNNIKNLLNYINYLVECEKIKPVERSKIKTAITNKITSARDKKRDKKLFLLQKYLFENHKSKDYCVYYNSKLFKNVRSIIILTDSYWYGDSSFIYTEKEQTQDNTLLLFPNGERLNEDINILNRENFEKIAINKKNWTKLSVDKESLKTLDHGNKFESLSFYIKSIKLAFAKQETREETSQSDKSSDPQLSSLQKKLFDKSKNVTYSDKVWQYKNNRDIYFCLNKMFIKDKMYNKNAISNIIGNSLYYGNIPKDNKPQTVPVLLFPSTELNKNIIRGNFLYSDINDIKKDSLDEANWKEFCLSRNEFRPKLNPKNALDSFEKFTNTAEHFNEDSAKYTSSSDNDAIAESAMAEHANKRLHSKPNPKTFNKNAINKLIKKLKAIQKDYYYAQGENELANRPFFYFTKGGSQEFDNKLNQNVWCANKDYPNEGAFKCKREEFFSKHLVLVLPIIKRRKKANKEELKELETNLLNPNNWTPMDFDDTNWYHPAASNNGANRINDLEEYVEMYKNGFKDI